MPIASLYGDVVTITLSRSELMDVAGNGELLIPGNGLPAPGKIRIVMEGHSEAHKTDPSAMYHVGYHREAVSPDMLVAFTGIAAVLVEQFSPKTTIDLGCSGGSLMIALQNLGVKAFGVDGSEAARAVNPDILVHDLRVKQPIPWPAGTFDLVTSFDTAEHMEEWSSDTICQLAAEAASPGGWVVFGAATPGQGGLGHINLQSHESWRARLERCGIVFDAGVTQLLRAGIQARPNTDLCWWVAKNLQAFRKPG